MQKTWQERKIKLTPLNLCNQHFVVSISLCRNQCLRELCKYFCNLQIWVQSMNGTAPTCGHSNSILSCLNSGSYKEHPSSLVQELFLLCIKTRALVGVENFSAKNIKKLYFLHVHNLLVTLLTLRKFIALKITLKEQESS